MRWLILLPVLAFLVAVVTYVALAPDGNNPTHVLATGDTGSSGSNGIPTSNNATRQPTQAPVPTATPLPLPDRTDCASIKGTNYRSDAERAWYIETCVPKPTPTPVVPAPNPPAIPGPEVTGERWVRVDIASQTMTAMIGDKALYTALVTTGKTDWETPKGSYNIIYRVANETMTGASIGAEENYTLTDVLYTQYFTNEGHAIHLNYWRPDYYFGEIPSSHGCVGVRLEDAEFFWKFLRNGSRVTIV